jgi:ribulose-5-phosphate 4-epimerase/fuculose-1-phosphate aldolase
MSLLAAKERRDLAAALRWAARLELHEGIDNHFSCLAPDGRMLINPFGLHWAEARASDMLLVDEHGSVVEGAGEIEKTAFYIHRAVHAARPEVQAAFHTHMPFITALSCVEGGRLEPIHQNAARFTGRIAYDDDFQGLALDDDEGERIARQLGDKQVLVMANHGVLVTGDSVAEAFDALYFIERAAQLQVLAHSTGMTLRKLPESVVRKTSEQKAVTVKRIAPLHFAALMRLLDRIEPDYAL